ncbi:hypothetical protein FRX31_004804 [Thalictrum thalictroides]|uniref:Uncharacterized protein n=1 Tax=Thalictrum thalictroides TaxID=46969 RepID=A0A7J6X7L0_THATH|nr:hypothetical protein FRX31_004804 [Thalictrum thalictroides]
MGVATSYMAECHGILESVGCALSRGWKLLHIKLDSEVAISTFHNNKVPYMAAKTTVEENQ